MKKLLGSMVVCILLNCTASAQTQPNISPITGKERAKWFVRSTIGAESLMAGALSAGWGVLRGSPEEYPNNITGFGQRFGMRLTGVSTGNAINASLGAVWGEDPRYPRAGNGPFADRVKHIFAYTFVTKYADDKTRFAYARLAGNVGNNALSNLWRVESEVGAGPTFERIGYGFLGQIGSNAFAEFWPNVWKWVRKK